MTSDRRPENSPAEESDEERSARHERERIAANEAYELERKAAGEQHERERLEARERRESGRRDQDDDQSGA